MIFLTERLKPVLLFLLVLGVFCLAGPLSVGAHDFTYGDPFVLEDLGVMYEQHDDTGYSLAESKGSMTLTVTNSTDVAWGDFHFGITTGSATFDPNEDPRWDRGSGLTTVGFTPFLSAEDTLLDLYFYSDPVDIGENVTFEIHTDNTLSGGLFGICFYPTPVPIPSAVWLLGSGLIGLIGFRRKRRR